MLKIKAMVNNTKTTSLKDHKRDGKKLTPPLLHIPNFTKASWANERLPEMLWATILISHLKREHALEIFRDTVQKISTFTEDFVDKKDINFNLTHSGINSLPEEKQREIISVIITKYKSNELLRSLLLLKNLPGYRIWKSILGSKPSKRDWMILQKAIDNTLWHQSQEATDCRWINLLFAVQSKKLMMPDIMADKIMYYPNHGDMREVRPIIRATEMTMNDLWEINYSWSSIFWEDVYKLTDCLMLKEEIKPHPDIPAETEKNLMEIFSWLLDNFSKTNVTTDIDSKHDTVFGLGLYAWRIASEILIHRLPGMVTGLQTLRTLSEIYINLAYLYSENDPGLWNAYRDYGIGQAKLVFLKMQEKEEKTSYIDINQLELLCNEDAWLEFVPIDLGHWGDKNLRTLSEQAKVKDIYDKYYVWPSGFTHGQWNAVRASVFVTCLNPLHRRHRIPKLDVYNPIFPDATNDILFLTNKIIDLIKGNVSEQNK